MPSRPARKSTKKKERDDIGYIATRLVRAVRGAPAEKPSKASGEAEKSDLEIAQDAAAQAHEHIRMQDAGFADILAKVYEELKRIKGPGSAP